MATNDDLIASNLGDANKQFNWDVVDGIAQIEDELDAIDQKITKVVNGELTTVEKVVDKIEQEVLSDIDSGLQSIESSLLNVDDSINMGLSSELARLESSVDDLGKQLVVEGNQLQSDSETVKQDVSDSGTKITNEPYAGCDPTGADGYLYCSVGSGGSGSFSMSTEPTEQKEIAEEFVDFYKSPPVVSGDVSVVEPSLETSESEEAQNVQNRSLLPDMSSQSVHTDKQAELLLPGGSFPSWLPILKNELCSCVRMEVQSLHRRIDMLFAETLRRANGINVSCGTGQQVSTTGTVVSSGLPVERASEKPSQSLPQFSGGLLQTSQYEG